MQDARPMQRRMAKPKEDPSIWPLLYPVIGILALLVLAGPKSLVISIPAGLLVLWWIKK
jgi:hypothetical protein